jgi:ABC-type multidrug transport system fused ATPase/permease subunit
MACIHNICQRCFCSSLRDIQYASPHVYTLRYLLTKSVVATSILQQVLVLLSNLTLRTWAERNADYGNNRGAFYLVLLYGLWCLLGTLAGLTSSILIWVLCGLKSARKLHDSMLHAVLRAPLSFFENTPTGMLSTLPIIPRR